MTINTIILKLYIQNAIRINRRTFGKHLKVSNINYYQ